MPSKDYYQILNISPTASLEELKKAYRKLALQYHPDTTKDDTENYTQFLEIKEAYKILSDTKKRQAYHYKNFYKSFKEQVVVTPEIILLQAKNLAGLVAVLDPYRIDYDRLSHQITQILNTSNSNALQQYIDKKLVEKVVINILKCTLLLQYPLALPIHQNLVLISSNNTVILTLIKQQTLHQKKLFYWHKYKLFIAVVAAIILCIYFYRVT